MGGKAILCRCEDTTLDDLEHAVSLGYRAIEEVKRYTGFGTGPCGGKECMALVAREIVRLSASVPTPPAQGSGMEPFTARPPITPVTLHTLANPQDRDPEGAGG